jgi:hypothetical protein
VALVPLSWETWRLGREAWSLAQPVSVVLSPDESRSLDLERAVLIVLHHLASLPPGTVDDATLRAVTAAHHIQLTALTDARGAGPAIVPTSGPATTLPEVRIAQRGLAEQAKSAGVEADRGDFAMLFAAIGAGTRQQMGALR